jgi:hypothetical protein
MSTVDLRGFAYALEPLRQRRQWQLDALQLRFARLQMELRAAQVEFEMMQATHKAAAVHVAGRATQQMDPRAHAHSLQWLAQLRARMAQSEALCERLEADCGRVGRACLSDQQKLNAIEAHRDDAVADFAQDLHRRQSVEADRDWLARRAVQGSRP